MMMKTTKAALLGCAMAYATLPATPANASDTLTSLDGVEGQWVGGITFGSSATPYDLEMSITPEGAEFKLSNRSLNCTYTVSPELIDGFFASYVTEDRRGGCSNSQVSLAMDQGNLRVLFTGQKTEAGRLVQITGPNTDARPYPDVTIRGIRMGTRLSELDALVPQGGTITQPKSSRRVAQGLTQLDGIYRQISVPYSEADYAAYSQDNIAAYTISKDANPGAMVITRYYAPSPLSAPKTDAFKGALVNAYGEPNQVETSGSRVEYSWHFGLDGNQATGASRTACEARIKSSAPGQRIAMLFNSLEFFTSGRAKEGLGGLNDGVQPKAGCGYSLKYITRTNQDGSLENAQAVFFDHRAVATSIWFKQRERLTKKIATQLKQIQAAASNAPEL